MIEINGKLEFLNNDPNPTANAYWNNKDLKFEAKHIFVRAGEFVIGSETDPF